MKIEKKQKIAEISKLLEPTHSIVPSTKAVQYWALLKYLPFAVDKLTIGEEMTKSHAVFS
jgi:hypothetical protein